MEENKLSFYESGLLKVADFSGSYESPNPDANQFRYKLVDGEVVDGWPGVADDDIMPLYDEALSESIMLTIRNDLKIQIKLLAKQKIEALGWKIERALEQDALNGTTTVSDVYAAREAIRTASNDAETQLDSALTNEAAIAIVQAFAAS